MPEILALQGFRDFLYRVFYATSQIQTGQNQNAKRVTGEATPCCITGTHSSFAADERIFGPAWRQIFQHVMRTLRVIKLDAGGRPRLESALEVRPFRSGSSISGKPDAEADLKLGIDNDYNA